MTGWSSTRRAFSVERDLTTEVLRRNRLYWQILKDCPGMGRYKKAQKEAYAAALISSLRRAEWHGGCVRISRDKNKVPDIERQVIDCVVRLGWAIEDRATPGYSKASTRLVPALPESSYYDPMQFDPRPDNQQLVHLKTRKRGKRPAQELPVDPFHPVVAEFWDKLAVINDVTSQFEFTCYSYDPDNDRAVLPVRRLWPTPMYAVFAGDYDQNGRIHAGKYSHQCIRGIQRESLHIDGVLRVELDFGGMHVGMAYHAIGRDYPGGDPYDIYDGDRHCRTIVKTLFNALLNGRSVPNAVMSVKNAMDPEGKTGRKRIKAVELQTAMKKTGLDLYGVARDICRHHEPIEKYIGSDAGVRFMRLEASIALDVLHTFAELGEPCISLHDSFCTLPSLRGRLEQAMVDSYRRQVGAAFTPKIKETPGRQPPDRPGSMEADTVLLATAPTACRCAARDIPIHITQGNCPGSP